MMISKQFLKLIKSKDKTKETFFDKDSKDEVEPTPQTTANTKMIQAMRKVQALHSDDANKLVKETAQEKSTKRKFKFFDGLRY